MRKTLLILLLFLWLGTFAQSTSWYKQLTGTIGNYPVTLHLHKAGSVYSGYYYYQSRQAPISFNGEDTLLKGRINLTAYSSTDATESFSFTFSGQTVSGIWRKETDARPLAFAAKETTGLALTYVFTEGEKKLMPKIAESPQATFFAGVIWPTGTSGPETFLKKMILQIYDEKATEGPVEQLLRRNKEDFFRQYAADFKDLKPADFRESSFMYNMDQSEQILLVYNDARLATIADYIYIYSGGAHGNYGTSFHSFDLVGKKKLKLADVVSTAGQKRLPALLAKALRAQFKLKPTDALTEVLFENNIAPNNNFYLTGKGIGFVYHPYEIAAYAVGEINLFILFGDLAGGLQPAFQKLLSP